MDGSDLRPGRSCPLSYRYSPAVFNRPAEMETETLYVVGGLYGNGPALDALLELAARELSPPTIVFNGDFNWFNIDPAQFERINKVVLSHIALRGNVETELASDDDQGCGCGYPDDVGDAEVERSNEILRTLRETAIPFANIRNALRDLPMHAVAQVGGLRVGIVHGDAESLSGWDFAQDQLDRTDRRESLPRIFADANVSVFASSHTCLPVLRQFAFGTIINNGAAGMPNFRDTRHGLITRIATSTASVPALYGKSVANIRIDAIPLHYDVTRWEAEFLAQWPAGSAAHASYWRRIQSGPGFALAQAAG